MRRSSRGTDATRAAARPWDMGEWLPTINEAVDGYLADLKRQFAGRDPQAREKVALRIIAF